MTWTWQDGRLSLAGGTCLDVRARGPGADVAWTGDALELRAACPGGTEDDTVELEVVHALRGASRVWVPHLTPGPGHVAGDAVLKQVAEVLRGQVRRVDVVARYGGEEFCLVLPQVAKADAVDVAEKLRRSIAERSFGNAPAGKVTASAGVAHLPTDATTLEGLLEAADAALYASKHRGRNCITAFEPGLDMASQEPSLRA